MPTPLECLMLSIATWEGGWQAFPSDPGNYLNGRLIGTHRGVTPPVLKAHLGIADDSIITAAFMQQTVTLEMAAAIGLKRFYRPAIEPLFWMMATDAVLDFAWGSGPGQAVKTVERDFLNLNNADYKFDQYSIAAWRLRVDTDPDEKMVWRFYDIREAFYDLICQRNPALAVYRQGWHNRAKWMTPGASTWWEHWKGESTDQVVGDAELDQSPRDRLPKAVLGVGSRGADVLAIQKALITKGYKLPLSTRNGVPDGLFGQELKNVVMRFQADHPPLKVDGWVGDQTRRALFGAGQLFGGPVT